MAAYQQRLIGKHRYRVRPLPYGEGWPLFLRLARVAGPALAEALGTADGGDIGELDVAKVAPALKTLLANLDEETFRSAQDQLAEATEVEVQPGKWPQLSTVMELHFSGQYMEALQWLAFALEVNFGGFLGDLKPPGSTKASV